MLITILLTHGSATAPAFGQPFYQGKTLRIIVTASPGGGSDGISRLLARMMPKYIPGKPSTIVQNIPGGGNIIGMNYLFAIAKPDGLTIGHHSIPGALDQLLGTAGIKFDYAKFGYVGNLGPTLQLFAIRASLPYKNMKDLKKAKKTIFVAAGSKGSTASVVANILAHEGFNIKAVPGYKGTAPRVQAVISGEADAAIINYLQALQEKQNFTPLFWAPLRGPTWTDLPEMEEMQAFSKARSFIKAITVPLTLARTFLAPPDTHRERLKILQKAFERTVKSPEFSRQMKKLHFPVHWRSAEETKALFLKVLNTSPEGVAALKKMMGISG